MDDARQRLSVTLGEHACRLAIDNFRGPDADTYELGHILGMVRIRGCYRSSELHHATIWYNEGDTAWIVDEAWPFVNPVELSEMDRTIGGFQTSLRFSNQAREDRREYRERIQEEIEEIHKLYAGLPAGSDDEEEREGCEGSNCVVDMGEVLKWGMGP